MQMNRADAALVLAAKRGSSDALGSLFDRYWPAVWRAAYAVTGQRELASDAAQDAFLRAAGALARFDHGRPLEPWLVRIAVNRALDLVRAQRRLAPLDEAGEPAGFDEPAFDDELLASIGRLDPGRRAVVALHYWFDYTTPEIAEVLGIPLGTVASRLSRALRDLRLHLEAPNV
jgi:RNA polymerase sigma-70 factor (ECF subfamily)